MQLKLIGRVLDKNEKDGMTYLTLNDVESGGQIKLSVPGGGSIEIDQKLSLDAVVKPGIGKYGLYLKVTKINQEGGNKQ